MVYMPLNTAWIKFRAASNEDQTPDPRLTDIDIKIADLDLLEPALQQARNVMLVTHNGINDFEFDTQENQINDIRTRIRNMRISQGVIAGLSLLVGGIGIMNIMLASINERIREIGTCKAVGASSEAIFTQIIVESIAVAMLGALVGLGFSFLLVELIEIASPAQNSPHHHRLPHGDCGGFQCPGRSGCWTLSSLQGSGSSSNSGLALRMILP